MMCREAQELLPDYADHNLPEMTRRRFENHLAVCDGCRSEYHIWKESSEWIQLNKEQYAPVPTARSIVDAVMSRILSEEKWAIPIGKKVFTLTAKMRRLGISAAVVLLMLCTFTLYTNTRTDEAEEAMIMNGEIVAMSSISEKTPVISSNLHDADGTYIVSSEPLPADTAEVDKVSGQIMPEEEKTDVFKPKYGIILSFFGILVTVIGMSWITRA
ncbi:anti-sigma factor [Brevibacillus fulvus]|uniref:Anti-sigma-W factor RsiW n=1 Tax=Brevibacillus fulvus TaxID=1125967 RepID=A0A938XV88_9BACL|nr:zf-HC2 domain-containing protein [Brevibacillus fulvus]MBM7588729.1 hypothetical protein [Brevibacillus fulvus]